jgi:hypothetical protein
MTSVSGIFPGQGGRMSACHLVSCVGQKQSKPVKAQDLYISEWFKKARAFVAARGSPWFILSAEHGLVDPTQVIAPYEKTLNQMGVREREAWASRVIDQMDKRLPECDEIVVLAGARYREFLMEYLARRAKRVTVPMENMRIGEQLSWLTVHRKPA